MASNDRTRTSIERTDVEPALQRVLSSPEFTGAERLRSLLLYLVDRALSADIAPKGYEIAVDVFGRGADFDPSTDAIVRVQVGRLRTALMFYYLTSGRDDPVVFELPKGAYKLSFRASQNEVPVPAASPSVAPPPPPQSTGLAILPFTVDPELSAVAKAEDARRAFTAMLSKAPALGRVVLATADDHEPSAELSRELSVRYLLSGSIAHVDREMMLTLHLVDGVTGASVWAQVYRAPIDEVERRWADMILNIAGTIRVRSYEAMRTEIAARGTLDGLTAAELSLLATWMPTEWANSLQHEEECIRLAERAVALDPRCGIAHSILADKVAYLGTVDMPSDTSAMRQRAAFHARRAIALAGSNPDALLNVILHHWHVGDTAKLRAVVERARNVDPFHPILIVWSKVAPHVGSSVPASVIDDLIAHDGALSNSNPARWMTQNWISRFLIKNGDFERAKDYALKAYYIFLTPETGLRVAVCFVQLRDIPSAIDIVDEIATRWPNIDLDYIARVVIPRQCGYGPACDSLSKVYGDLAHAVALVRSNEGELKSQAAMR